jgi:hypothetical protein
LAIFEEAPICDEECAAQPRRCGKDLVVSGDVRANPGPDILSTAPPTVDCGQMEAGVSAVEKRRGISLM